MKRHTTTIALAAILVPSACFGWGRDGHRIVGYIAANYLTPQAAAAVKDLLGNASLADVSTWADQIRRERKHTAPWHYAKPPPRPSPTDSTWSALKNRHLSSAWSFGCEIGLESGRIVTLESANGKSQLKKSI